MNNTSLDQKIRAALNARKLYCPLDVMQGERSIARKAFKDGLTTEKGMAKFRRSQVLHGSFSWTNSRTKLTDTHVTLSKRLGAIKVLRESISVVVV